MQVSMSGSTVKTMYSEHLSSSEINSTTRILPIPRGYVAWRQDLCLYLELHRQCFLLDSLTRVLMLEPYSMSSACTKFIVY